jgi:lysophospholipase L1-like esterase
MPRARKLAIVVAAAVLALALAVPPASASGGGGVLVVGDSLEVLTSPYLKKYLPGVPLTVNAEGGYNSYQIFELFQESYDPSQSVIVFDAGTNDNPAYPQILAENLSKVAAAIGDRCMVVPTIHGLTVNGIDNAGKNRTVRAFAASRPGTQVPDWAGFVATHPELMQPDNLHPIEAGADARARLIARGVEGCLGLASAAPAPARKSALESGPELAPVGKLARREEAVTAAIATGLAREVALAVASRSPSLAAALAMLSIGPDA